MVKFLAIVVSLLIVLSDGKKIVKEKNRRHPDEYTADDSSNLSPHDHSLVVEHAFGKEPFTRRGTLHLKSLKSSKDVTFHQEYLTSAQLKLLQKAAASNGLYTIRTNSKLFSVDEEIPTENVTMVSTFISACAVMKSNFKDHVVIHGDGKGNVFGLTLLPATSVLNDDTDCSLLKASSSSVSFNTVISYSTGETGPSPDTQGFIQKFEAEKAKMETEDNRSFFQKYWLYLLIGFVAFQFLGGAAGGGGGGGGGSSGGG